MEYLSVKLSPPILSKKNERLIGEFFDSLPLIKQKRKSKYISKLSAMGRDLGDFEKVTRAQLRKYIEKIEASEMQPWTKRDYKLIAKKFFKWLNNTDFGMDQAGQNKVCGYI